MDGIGTHWAPRKEVTGAMLKVKPIGTLRQLREVGRKGLGSGPPHLGNN